MRISVIIPTFRRVASFERAVESALGQRCAETFEIVAIDNSPEGCALETCRAFEARHEHFRYAHEPSPGVSNARNAALALARGDLLVFLDDDQEAPADWLASLLAVADGQDADVVWGPVAPACAVDALAPLAQSLYTRTGPARSCAVTRFYGIGNSLVRRSEVFPNAAPFDVRANETGGEDDRLFSSLRGARFAWCAGGGVIEHIPDDRLSALYLLRRAFAYGQGACENAFHHRRFAAIGVHMAIGAAQALVFGATALLAFCIGARARWIVAGRVACGLGKVIWFRKQVFYGRALDRDQARRANRRSTHAALGSASA